MVSLAGKRKALVGRLRLRDKWPADGRAPIVPALLCELGEPGVLEGQEVLEGCSCGVNA